MKCVAERTCQVKMNTGKIRFFLVGETEDFDECPVHFRVIEGDDVEIDFSTAQEEELLEAEYDLDELKAYIEETYDRKAGNRGKDKTVEMLLDCRYRALDTNPNDMGI